MRCDQIAIYVHSEAQADKVKRGLGVMHEEWIEDHPVGKASVFGGPKVELKAILRFNYDFLAKTELELITCLTPDHAYTAFPAFAVGKPSVCHFGYHED